MSEKCPYHDAMAKDVSEMATSFKLLQKDIEYLRRDQEVILARFGNHVEEAEKEGGRHDRLNKVESAIEQIKKDRANDLIMSRWFMIGSGVLSGGIVTGCVKVWSVLSKLIGG